MSKLTTSVNGFDSKADIAENRNSNWKTGQQKISKQIKGDGKQKKKKSKKKRMGHSRKVYLQSSVRQNSKMAPMNTTPLFYKPA